MGTFAMPSLGADMDRGTIVEWLVAPGDQVARGDIIAVVDTEKSTIEVEVFESGVVTELLVEPGVEVDVGTPLASIGPSQRDHLPESAVPELSGDAPEPPSTPAPTDRSERGAEELAPSAAALTGSPPPIPHRPRSTAHHISSPLVRSLAERLRVDLAALTGTGPGGRITRHDVEAAARTPGPPEDDRARASPLARRLARDTGIDLRSVAGSGPAGAVLARDLSTHASAAPPTPASLQAVDPRRRAVADLMARSKREIPHYYLRTTVDLSRVMDSIESANRDRPPSTRLVPAAFLLWAAVQAAAREPGLNGHWIEGRLVPIEGVRLGVAISLRGGGLLAPVVDGAHLLDVEELMARLRDLTTRARKGVMRGSEMGQPSITVTNLGDRGVEEVFGVIYPPQVAMLGFGRIALRPWVVDGMVTACPVVTVTLAGDHRASNGHEGSRLLSMIDKLLQRPEDAWTSPTPIR